MGTNQIVVTVKMDTETAKAVKVKIGRLKVVGKSMTTCQELRRFF